MSASDLSYSTNAPTSAQSRDRRRIWTAITAVLVAAIFAEVGFAGGMLSGTPWARAAHSTNAILLIAAFLLAGSVALIMLRRVADGWKLGANLLAVAAIACVQTALGHISAHGTNLMWVHVPLGVALVGLAMQSLARARQLD